MSDCNTFELSLHKVLLDLCAEYRLFSNSLQYGNDNDDKDSGFKKIRIFEEEFPAFESVPHEERKGVYSTSIALIKAVTSKKSKYTGMLLVKIKDVYLPHFPVPTDAEIVNSEQDYIKFYVSPSSVEFMDALKELISFRIRTYRSCNNSFGCCSAFNECSDNKHCVHYNQLYSTGCLYRVLHLDKGEILYGKNRTV